VPGLHADKIPKYIREGSGCCLPRASQHDAAHALPHRPTQQLQHDRTAAPRPSPARAPDYTAWLHLPHPAASPSRSPALSHQALAYTFLYWRTPGLSPSP
jgi:hypothetical protein